MYRRPLSLNELLELNDLFTITVRGESPLVDSLRIAAEGTSSRFRKILLALCRDLENGMSLSQALAEQPQIFSASYRQIVQSGEQGQHLGPVLEAYSSYLWQVIQLRRTLGRALIYPLIVMVTAYLLFVIVGGVTTSRFVEFYETTPMPLTPVLQALQNVYSYVLWWFWIPPLLFLMAWIYWLISRRNPLQAAGGAGLLCLIPGVSMVLRLYRLANFTEVLSLMLHDQVPFAQALQISAHASGDRQILEMSHSAGQLQSTTQPLPPFLRWLMQMSAGNNDLGQTLQHAAEMYRRRADMATEWMRILAPVAFLLMIGGGATLFYVLTVYYPFTQMLHQL